MIGHFTLQYLLHVHRRVKRYNSKRCFQSEMKFITRLNKVTEKQRGVHIRPYTTKQQTNLFNFVI